MPRKKPNNPFYVLLLIVGAAFAITTCAYFVMAWHGREGNTFDEVDSGSALLVFMDKHGFNLMVGELIVLAILTFAAIATAMRI